MVFKVLQTLKHKTTGVSVVNQGLIATLFFFMSTGVSTADITGVKSASKTRTMTPAETHTSEVRMSPNVAETTGSLRCWQSGELIIDEAGIAFLPIKDGSTMVTFGLKGTVTSRLFMEGDTTCFYKTK